MKKIKNNIASRRVRFQFKRWRTRDRHIIFADHSNYQSGFGVVEVLILVVVFGLIGGVGYYVFSKNKVKDQPGVPAQAQQASSNVEKKKTTPYTFKELGISMDLNEGWKVTKRTVKEEGANYYIWTVKKASADGKIDLSSSGFRGGFSGCEEPGSFNSAMVDDISPTQNKDLIFLAWSFAFEEGYDTAGTVIVRADGKHFKATNDNSTDYILNKDLKTGKYFYCSSEPIPGGSLKLNKEPVPAAVRVDSIQAHTNSDFATVPLSTTDQSYAEIKEMLTSIK